MATHVIGLTGAFGTGCTTAAKYLRDEMDFRMVKLSTPIRNAAEAEDLESPTREDLQRLGDTIRESDGVSALVDRALTEIADPEEVELLVVDGIRNVGEIQRLRERFGHAFTLFGVVSSTEERWARIGSAQYKEVGLDRDQFFADDFRDQDEDMPHGQQVVRCVDQADVLLGNSGTLPEFHAKVREYAELAIGSDRRPPTDDERYMHMAFSASHGSQCLKRNVGAVIVSQDGNVIAAGYNENPVGTNPCVHEPEYGNRCYRDVLRDEHFETLADSGMSCPECTEGIPPIKGPPWRCPNCDADLGAIFFPDRAMNWCTAIHAEVWAVLVAGDRAKGGALYTTTFPCFQCAEKISQAGIDGVCFTEAYPDLRSADRLVLAGIEVRQFEGVRSSAFERVFGAMRPS